MNNNGQEEFKKGWTYYYGEGTDQNYEEALKWFKLAAGQKIIKNNSSIKGKCSMSFCNIVQE